MHKVINKAITLSMSTVFFTCKIKLLHHLCLFSKTLYQDPKMVTAQLEALDCNVSIIFFCTLVSMEQATYHKHDLLCMYMNSVTILSVKLITCTCNVMLAKYFYRQ